MTIKTRIVQAYYHEWIELRGRSMCRLCGVDQRSDGTYQPPCKAPYQIPIAEPMHQYETKPGFWTRYRQ